MVLCASSGAQLSESRPSNRTPAALFPSVDRPSSFVSSMDNSGISVEIRHIAV